MSVAIIVIILTTLLCHYDSRHNSNKGLIFSAIIIMVFGGLRFEYGSDYPSYFRLFQDLSLYSFHEDLSNIRTEVGWNLLNILCKPIGFFGLVIVTTTFETIVIYRLIYRYVDRQYRWFANLCYTLNTSLMLLGFSMMRQFLAMCIFLLAIDYIINKKWIIAVPITMLAGLFHTSAFVLTPFCFVGYLGEKDINKSLLLGLSLFIIVFYFLGGPLLDSIMPDLFAFDVFEEYGDVYNSRYGSKDSVSMFSIARIYGALIFVFLVAQYRKLKTTEKNFSILYSMSVLFGSLVAVNSMAGRINLYFAVTGIVVLPLIVKYPKDPSFRIGFVSVYIIFLLYRFVVFFNTPIWESFLHYHTIFEQPWQ